MGRKNLAENGGWFVGVGVLNTRLLREVEIRLLIVEYMGHYNHVRPHSNTGMSPVRYEQHNGQQAKEREKM